MSEKLISLQELRRSQSPPTTPPQVIMENPYIVRLSREIVCSYSSDHYMVHCDQPFHIDPEDVDLEARDMFDSHLETQMERDGWIRGIHPDVYLRHIKEIHELERADDYYE